MTYAHDCGDKEFCEITGMPRRECALRQTRYRRLYKSFGIDPDLDIKQAVADFYLLEWMASDGDTQAKRTLSSLEHFLTKQFARYLCIIIGGEARHIAHQSGVPMPDSLFYYAERWEASRYSRKEAWKLWANSDHTIEEYRDIQHAFADPNWGDDQAGGGAWSVVVRVYTDFIEGKLKERTFIDRCFTLEHNNANVFDKMFDIRGLPEVLETQAHGDYRALTRHASPTVRSLWTEYQRRYYEDFDPVWLGVQHTE